MVKDTIINGIINYQIEYQSTVPPLDFVVVSKEPKASGKLQSYKLSENSQIGKLEYKLSADHCFEKHHLMTKVDPNYFKFPQECENC